MADVKISALTDATALASGDEFAIVQSGVTKRITGGEIFGAPLAIGGTTPAAGTFTTLTTTGNVTLGDATTDTVTVNGYAAIGTAVDSTIGLLVGSSALTGTAQRGIVSNVVATSGATASVVSFQCSVGTAASAFTVTDAYGFRAANATKGAGSTITNLYGFYAVDQTQGTNNYGFYSAVTSGANKYSIYTGTAQSYFGGNVFIGTGATTGTDALETGISTSAAVLHRFTNSTTGYGAGNGLAIGIDASENAILSNSEATDMIFYTSAAERLRIDSSGNVLIGATASRGMANGAAPTLIYETTTNAGGMGLVVNNNSATSGPFLVLAKSRGAAVGGTTIVQSGDDLGSIYWAGADGGDLQTQAANIRVIVDGTPGVNDMPGAMTFGTTADGANTVTERMRITSNGDVGIGATPPTYSGRGLVISAAASTAANLQLQNATTGNTGTDGFQLQMGSDNVTAYLWNYENGGLRFATNNTERARITSVGNMQLGGSGDRSGTVGTNHLDIFDGTAPVGTLANGISIYSTAGECYIMDAAGNATLQSPHDKETNEWIFKSTHTPTGKTLRIDVEKMLRFINEKYGLNLITET